MATALLATKLFVPPLRPRSVPRPRLAEHIRAGLAGKLTLLVAPAGFGKTTLLSEAIAGHPVAWVSLDAGDNDVSRFWSYVLVALNGLVPGIGDTTLALLRSSQPPTTEAIVTSLLNALTAMPRDAALVLDDYHVIDAAAIHDGLTLLLEHLAPRLRVVVASRSDPPLRLARLRARAELTELRAVDLRFTADEAAAFLATMLELPLSADEVAALEARTEGWIAGLQLAALALRDRADRADFIAAFTGSHRFVVDYLAEEVLVQLPPQLLTFLLHTSILDRLCGPLCDALLQADEPAADHRALTDGRVVLEQLERDNLFVLPLDDERYWYRYHHLFADVLRQRLLSDAGSAVVTALHRRASRWYEAEQLVPAAIQHALAAGAFDDAARLVEQIQWAVFGESAQGGPIAAWLAALPEAEVRSRSRLCLAQALLARRTLPIMERWMQDAEAAVEHVAPQEDRQVRRGEIAAFQATLAMYTGDAEQASEHAQHALAVLPADNVFLRSTATMMLGQAQLLHGDFPGAEAAFGDVAATATSGNFSGAISAACSQAYLQRAQGRLQAALDTCQQMLDRANRLRAGTLPEVGFVLAGLADLARERNELPIAWQQASDALALNAAWADPFLRQIILLVQARVQQAHGDLAGARLILDEAKGIEHAASPLFDGILEAYAIQLALARGDTVAPEWVDANKPDEATAVSRLSPLFLVYVAEHSRIAPLQVLIAAGRVRADRALLLRALVEIAAQRRLAELSGLGWLSAKLHVLQALAAHALGDTAQAIAALEHALEQAAQEAYVRLFLDEGMPMAALLREATTRGSASEQVARLLAAFADTTGTEPGRTPGQVPGTRSSSLVEPLSVRELEILRLIAAGHSNQAIADQLVVAVSTVKKHVNNLYGKLAVKSRTQALARARDLDLL